MIIIPLTQGYEAWIDDEDAAMAALKWCAHVHKRGHVYAVRNPWDKALGRCVTKALHREILGVTDPKVLVDHLDGNTLDCRRHNIKEKTNAQNQWNRVGAMSNKSPGIPLGVQYYKAGNKWIARIMVNGVTHQSPQFDTMEEAAKARIEMEITLWGRQPRREAAYA